MEQKRAIDGFGAAALIGFALLLAVNQVVIKLTGGGFGPVFQAGLRSVLGLVVLLIWMRLRGLPVYLPRWAWPWAILTGSLFAFEFMCLYAALDLTTVSRASIVFYSMPVWLALMSHLLLPGEKLRGARVLGLALAMGGVVLALAGRSGGQASLLGDVLALMAAILWAGIVLCLRLTPLARVAPEMQLLSQVVVSAPILLGLAPFFGDMIRAPQMLHLAGVAFQAIGVVGLGYLLWFWLMTIYRASAVASFSFLTPVFAVILGWLLLGEQIDLAIWAALGLVTAGIFLFNGG